jgi:hypothetical protein
MNLPNPAGLPGSSCAPITVPNYFPYFVAGVGALVLLVFPGWWKVLGLAAVAYGGYGLSCQGPGVLLSNGQCAYSDTCLQSSL